MSGDILITGATGLIGGEIAWRLMKSGRRVWCIVRSRSSADAAARLERRFALSGPDCDWSGVVALPGDVTQVGLGLTEDSFNRIRQQRLQVIHCAAETSFATTNRCNEINVVGTGNVLEFCSSLGPQARLFHMSSAVVCLAPEGGVISEDTPYGGFVNDYVRSKRQCEEIVRRSNVDSVILRPSIVLSHGVRSREFARSVAWVMPMLRRLGVAPFRGDERVDLVSVCFVAEAVVRLVEKTLRHRVYHLTAGTESSVTWSELFDALTQGGHDYSKLRFGSELDWALVGESDFKGRRIKQMVDYYLPFMRGDVVYDCGRLRHALGDDLPACPKVTDYGAELLSLFDEHEAFEEAMKP